MIGLIPVRTHGAETAVQREHESILVEWMRTGLAMQRVVISAEGMTSLAGFLLAALIVFGHLGRAEDTSSVLLLVYWALALPALGQAIALAVRQYPAQRSVTMRLTEPLGALERDGESTTESHGPAAGETGDRRDAPVALEMKGVAVRIAGRTILQDVDLQVAAAAHVAIVGPSGAGKSTLVGLLLGWHRTSSGSLLVDEAPLTSDRLPALRRRTVWVDPAVRIWNRSLIRNVQYGNEDESGRPFGHVLQEAALHELLERLPDGLQTRLGEGGGLISGGEGQRVRLARGLFRAHTGLVILDEPFRGLDREKRRMLLERARRCWSGATMLCIMHDVGDAAAFDRVVVVDGGRIVEVGEPRQLLDREDSRFRKMVSMESMVRSGEWSGVSWRNLVMDDGKVSEKSNGKVGDARAD
jgi:ATP-binding cassette subfamily B protein